MKVPGGCSAAFRRVVPEVEAELQWGTSETLLQRECEIAELRQPLEVFWSPKTSTQAEELLG